jgi:transcriptional regulator with XRE-family HTH domain
MVEHDEVLSAGLLVGSFALALRQCREARRLSQSRLAAEAGFDHSYVSRLESGTRTPTREAVMRLGQALSLDDSYRDSLLVAAGFMPMRVENLLAAEPIVGEVLSLLQDRAVPDDVRDDLRTAITLAVRQAQRAAPALEPAGAGAHSSIAAD